MSVNCPHDHMAHGDWNILFVEFSHCFVIIKNISKKCTKIGIAIYPKKHLNKVWMALC